MTRAADICFETPPAFVPLGERYQTACELHVPIGDIKSVLHVVVIPKGYSFDGASIPRCLWSVIGSPFEPSLMRAACVHDWYCENTAECYQSRVIGDAVFFYLLTIAGVARWRRVFLYLGVRLHSFWTFGRFAK